MQNDEKDRVLKEVLETLEQATRRVRQLLAPEPQLPRKRLVYAFRPDGSLNLHHEGEA